MHNRIKIIVTAGSSRFLLELFARAYAAMTATEQAASPVVISK